MTNGIVHLSLTSEEMSDFMVNIVKSNIDIEKLDISENNYVILEDTMGNVLDKYKIRGGKFIRLPYITVGKKSDKFKPLNVEQECLFDLLNNDSLPIKVVTGIAGTGKTKSALKFGFEKIFDQNSPINKIMLVRNPVAVGNEVGYFKGSKMDKLGEWNNPARDNLQFDRLETLEELVSKGYLELEIPATMQGRDIKNTWIIVDECQQMTYEQVKMVGSRVAHGSQIVFLGDLDQIFHNKYKTNNGLRRLYNLRGNILVGMVNLVEDVRSETSKLFATMY